MVVKKNKHTGIAGAKAGSPKKGMAAKQQTLFMDCGLK
jgi:hypothetical protein